MTKQGLPDLSPRQVNSRKIQFHKFVNTRRQVVDEDVTGMIRYETVKTCDNCGLTLEYMSEERAQVEVECR